jgi:hypothetical protein
MMSKWDTIQADVADAYVYLDEELEIEQDEETIYGHGLVSLEDLADEELELALDWESNE